MSLDKAILHGKEHRDRYKGKRKAGNVSKHCRPHGACQYCKENRLYQVRKGMMNTDEQIKGQ